MKGKTIGLVIALLGLLLIVAAVVVRVCDLARSAQWPDDVDSTRNYEGHTEL